MYNNKPSWDKKNALSYIIVWFPVRKNSNKQQEHKMSHELLVFINYMI